MFLEFCVSLKSELENERPAAMADRVLSPKRQVPQCFLERSVSTCEVVLLKLVKPSSGLPDRALHQVPLIRTDASNHAFHGHDLPGLIDEAVLKVAAVLSRFS